MANFSNRNAISPPASAQQTRRFGCAFIKNGHRIDGKNIPSCRGDKHGLAPCSPAPGQRIEQAGTGFATRGAATAKIKAPCRDGVPVAADQSRSTTMTIGALARLIMHVPSIDVAQSRL